MSKKATLILISIVLVLAIASTTLGVVAFCIDNVSFAYDIDVDRQPYEYSIDLSIAYESAMSKMLGSASNALEDFALFKSNLWLAFSNARVAQSTLEKFIAEINSYDWEDSNNAVAQFASKFFSLSEDDSNKIVSVATEKDMLNAVLATFDFLDRIDATADEIGRFSYHLIYLYADAEHRALMDKAGQENWTMLTIGTYTAGQLASSRDVYSNLSSARSVGQALTSLGYAYSQISDAVGKDNLSALIGIDNLKSIDESNLENGRLDEYRVCVNNITEDFSQLFMLSADLMRAQNTLLYEELYLCQAKLDRGEDTDTHLVYAMYNLAQGIKSAINRLKINANLSSDQETIAYIAEYYASCATFTDIIYSDARNTFTGYLAIAESELTNISNCVNTLYSQEFESFYQVKKCATDEPELFAELLSVANNLINTQYDYEDVLTRLIYTVSIASIVAIM